ncbi:hypothetical protein DUI87_33084 [Hirundo rustica rustica]|uniref:SANT domain-containing protein n=1 Tax=Hirundo rustica rustica TaxID=333673 RepID=A0A3M0IUJ8_HIRRU|nr:hypothetical protein DUI87_33084 [Hirundo rustica rustica]
MRLSRQDVAEVTANPDLGARALRQLDCQLVSLKRQVQRIKQINSGLRQALDGGLEGLRPPEGSSKFSSRWTPDEQLLVVQALRRYGRDFPAVAAVLGTKRRRRFGASCWARGAARGWSGSCSSGGAPGSRRSPRRMRR